MLFRQHKGSLLESMDTIVEVETISDLVQITKKSLSAFNSDVEINEKTISCQYYSYDNRIDWNTYIITLENYGVLGFTNGLIEGNENAEK